MQKPWRRIRKLADLPDVRIHDLRHTFASNGVAMGQGLPLIGRLLCHTQTQTTARYAHLDAAPALEVADKISESLARYIEWKDASKSRGQKAEVAGPNTAGCINSKESYADSCAFRNVFVRRMFAGFVQVLMPMLPFQVQAAAILAPRW